MEKIEINIKNLDSYFLNESFKTLRTNIQFCGADIKVIEFTSNEANEGKTTVSLMLAKSLADINKKVIYVDCDLRKSVVAAKYLSNKNIKGMSEYLSGLASKEEIIYSTQFENMDIIVSGPICPNPVELMSSDKFSDFIAELKQKYDYVIIDTPPLGLVIDSAVIAKVCDGAAIVIGVGRIKYKYAQEVKAQLEKSGCRILGVVLNHVVKKSDRYYKGYYSKYYGKGYYGNIEKYEAEQL